MTAALISPGRFIVRVLQVVCPIIAMIFLSLGSIEFSSGQLSSGSAVFTNIVCYSAALCGFYYVVALGVFKLTDSVPNVLYQRAVDGALAIALLLAGVFHATSTLVKDCASLNIMFETYHGSTLFRCGDITVSVVLTFVTCALFLVTLVWSFTRNTCWSTKGDRLEVAPAQEEVDGGIKGYEEAATPGKKDLDDAVWEQMDLQHPVLKLTRRCVRLLQFACSLVAFILFVASYKPYYSGQYVSPAATYVILMAYSGWLYALWHTAVVETLKLSRRPKVGVERLMDLLVAVLLLVAGVIFAVSSQVTDCEATNEVLETYHQGSTLYRCGNMDAGYVFAFVAVALYLITFAMSFLYRSASGNAETDVGQQVGLDSETGAATADGRRQTADGRHGDGANGDGGADGHVVEGQRLEDEDREVQQAGNRRMSSGDGVQRRCDWRSDVRSVEQTGSGSTGSGTRRRSLENAWLAAGPMGGTDSDGETKVSL